MHGLETIIALNQREQEAHDNYTFRDECREVVALYGDQMDLTAVERYALEMARRLLTLRAEGMLAWDDTPIFTPYKR